MNTKKIIFAGVITTLGVFAVALPAFAATTASFVPTPIKVATGQQFNVVVMVNPQGVKNYAEKVEVDYPANLLQVISFTPGNSWMTLQQPGYDSINNNTGVMIKTAGYPTGFSSQTLFGTILFTAKKAGSGTIAIDNQSIAFKAGAQTTTLTGTPAPFTISVATVPAASTTPAALAPVSTVNGQAIATATTPAGLASTANSQLAAAAANAGGVAYWVWILLVIAIILVIVLFILYRNRKGKM